METQAVVDFIAARISENTEKGENPARKIARQLLTHAVVDLYAKDNVTIVLLLLKPPR